LTIAIIKSLNSDKNATIQGKKTNVQTNTRKNSKFKKKLLKTAKGPPKNSQRSYLTRT